MSRESPPILVSFDGERFTPANKAMLARCTEWFMPGEVYRIEFQEDRSDISHKHFHATVNDYWKHLPEKLQEDFQSPKDLRGYALIKGGFAEYQDVVLGDESLAKRIAAFLTRLRHRYFSTYAIFVPRGTTVRIYTPQSQSKKAMNRKTFQASKEAVFGVLQELTGIEHKAISANVQDDDPVLDRNQPALESPKPELTDGSGDTPPPADSGGSTASAGAPPESETPAASPEQSRQPDGGELKPKTYNEYLRYLPVWLGFTTSATRIRDRYAREQQELWPTFRPRLTEFQERYFNQLVADRLKGM